MKEVCPATRNVGSLGVLAKLHKVHLLLGHVIAKADEVKIRRNENASLFHQLSSKIGKNLRKREK